MHPFNNSQVLFQHSTLVVVHIIEYSQRVRVKDDSMDTSHPQHNILDSLQHITQQHIQDISQHHIVDHIHNHTVGNILEHLLHSTQDISLQDILVRIIRTIQKHILISFQQTI